MSALTETAYAKVNLALHVRRKRSDGYHDLETLFAFAEDGDILDGVLSDSIRLTITGPFADGLSDTDNLVVRAAKAVQGRFAVAAGAHLSLNKLLPVASGIGGGSADAAATARLLNRLWGIGAEDGELEQLLGPLGADIPACVRSHSVYGGGTGTTLIPVDDRDIRGRPLLLVNPLLPVATSAVFNAWDGIDRGELGSSMPWLDAASGRNDLQTPAVRLCPDIAAVLAMLDGTGAILTRMSGSGATCFSIFEDVVTRDAAQARIASACPQWWTMASFLR
ncbi:MAG: 4-(cytidine 5'-diphospho)-2-C-methyl-D-erythritol kinase [Sphingomonadaceae bacterium]|nr:4-(cytidine 5'-diphospho)-2-C-methyl-D-erythritol kinase [Sphingomonadaceae bacterium]